MEQYISKSALVAEIERLFEKAGKSSGEYRNGAEHTLISINDFLDTLEVKESAELQHVDETCKNSGDSLTQEPAINVWHDAQTDPPQAKEKILATNEYGDCEVDFAINMVLYWKKVIKWAYIEDLLNLSNVQRTVKNSKELASEGLEKAAVEAFKQIVDSDKNNFLEIFKAGAKWQAEQFEKNRLAACDRQAEEEAEIERDFVMGIIENEHRQPTFDDAIKYGIKKTKEQMMANSADAMIGLPYENKDGGYTQLIDVSRPLPIGNNKIAIIFKEG